MLKEGVRLDRVRGGRQKYRRNPDSPYQLQVVTSQRPMVILEGKLVFQYILRNIPEYWSCRVRVSTSTMSHS